MKKAKEFKKQDDQNLEEELGEFLDAKGLKKKDWKKQSPKKTNEKAKTSPVKKRRNSKPPFVRTLSREDNPIAVIKEESSDVNASPDLSKISQSKSVDSSEKDKRPAM